jgi:pblA
MNVLTGSMSKQEGIDLMKTLGINEGTADSIVSIADNIRTAFQNIWEAIKNVGAIVGEFVGDLLGINDTESSVSSLGTAFEVLSGVVKEISQWIKDFTSFLKENEVAMSLTKATLAGLSAGFLALKVIETVKNLFTGFQIAVAAARTAMMTFNATLLANPITAIIVGITAVVAALVWFFTKTETGKKIWQGFVDFIKQAWNGIVEFFSGIWNGITTGASTLWTGIQAVWSVAVETVKSLWQGVIEFFTGLWNGIKESASTAWTFITTSITAIVQPFIDAFLNGWEILKTGLTAVWEGVKMVIQGAWEFIKAIVMGAVLIVIDLVTGNFSKLKEDLQLIWDAIKAAVQLVWEGIKTVVMAIVTTLVSLLLNAWEGFKNGLVAIWNFLSTTASTIWNAIKSAVTSIVTGLVNGIKALWEGFKSFFTGLINSVQSIAVNTWNSIKSSVTSIIQGLVNAAQNAWNTFKNGVQNLVNRVKNIFDSIKNIDLWGAGKAIMDGFLRGLKSVWGSITSFVGSIADWIRDHKGPIEVDRKLLIPAGTAIMESLDEGLTDKFESVKKTVGGMAGDINKAFTSEMTDFEVGANVSKNLQIDDMSKADFSMGDDDNEVIKALGVVQDLLKDISNKDFNTYLDGEVMAKNSYDRQITFVRREGI